MRLRAPDPDYLKLLRPYGEVIQKLALSARKLILVEAPEASEFVYQVYTIANHFTFTQRPSDAFVFTTTHANWINLGFNFGSQLPDPSVDPAVAEAQRQYAATPFEFTIDRMERPRLFSYRWHPHAHEPGVDYSHEPTTLIVFTSDHGEEMGDHWLLGKGGYFDGSYRVPLIVRDPRAGASRGTRICAKGLGAADGGLVGR